jgi:two-component system OmpR family response regulator
VSAPVPPERILIVDDDPHIREVVRFALERHGYASRQAAGGREALVLLEQWQPQLVILDILMPDLDGTEVCRVLRRRARTPIIFLSSKSDEIDRIVGLELGGDDYLTKPFSPRELVARVRAVLRRASHDGGPAPVPTLAWGELRLDPERCEVTIGGQPIPLTVTELGLLRTLLQRPSKVFTRDELMLRAYGEPTYVAERTITSHIRRLRGKLGAAGLDPIETVHGLGYRLRRSQHEGEQTASSTPSNRDPPDELCEP